MKNLNMEVAERILAAIDGLILVKLNHLASGHESTTYQREDEEKLMDLCRARLAIVQSMVKEG